MLVVHLNQIFWLIERGKRRARKGVMMATDIYERLAEHLDNLPGGFPRTESGVEMRILRRLFTPEDAKLAVHLTLIPEEPRVVARRARIPVGEASQRLEGMVKAGLIIGVYPKNKSPLYMAEQFLVGFWESQVNQTESRADRRVRRVPAVFHRAKHRAGSPPAENDPRGEEHQHANRGHAL